MRILPQIASMLALSATVFAQAPQEYYTRQTTADGIVIKASATVNPKALREAKSIVELMLKHSPDLATRMAEKHAELAIVPKDAVLSTLPEYAQYSGRNDANGNGYDTMKIRGGGGIPSQPVTATSEENLLRLPGDVFFAEDITCHEFGHAVMNLGFTDDQREKWHAIYEAAKSRNLFPGTYATTNADEYWAELSQSYFGVNNEINTPETIKKADPAAYHVLVEVYGEKPGRWPNRP